MENVKKKINLKDWKFWMLMASIAMFIASMVILIICEVHSKKGDYLPTLSIVGITLFAVSLGAIFLSSALKTASSGGKKNIISAIITGILGLAMCIVLLLDAVAMPKMIELQIARDEAFEEWESVSYDDKELYSQKKEAYYEAKDRFSEFYEPRERMLTITYFVCMPGLIILGLVNTKSNQMNEYGANDEKSDVSEDKSQA